MQNKRKLFGLLSVVFSLTFMSHVGCYAVDFDDDAFQQEFDAPEDFDYSDNNDQSAQDVIGAESVANYNVDGSLFQQITDLEQQKILMELEKERAQLDLDLDRLAAEKIKLQMEMDTLSGRADQEKQVLQNEKSRLEAEAARIEKEKLALITDDESGAVYDDIKQPKVKEKKQKSYDSDDIASMYRLLNVMGAGDQLMAMLYDLETGQTKRVVVGKIIDGFTVKSISLEDGVVFTKDGETQNLNISNR